MEPIVLRTKQELDIYINPQRQNILRHMRIAGEPMTPKQLADRIGISASSVQHHIGRLLAIGVVELRRTEIIHGILARYYGLVPRMISIGLGANPDQLPQRIAVLQNAAAQAFAGFADYCAADYPQAEPGAPIGDMLYGILHLEPEQAKELLTLVHRFIQAHEAKTERSSAWEYAMIAYPVREDAP